jgi:transposase InsO family protein
MDGSSNPPEESPMMSHANAKLTSRSRKVIVRRVLEDGDRVTDVAADFGISDVTVYKWLRRFRDHGEPALADRKSTPQTQPLWTSPKLIAQIDALRRQRLTYKRISEKTGVPATTVAAIAKRRGLSKLKDLDPPEPVRRYEREAPGELLHFDIKRLGKIAGVGRRFGNERDRADKGHRGKTGYEFAHVCIDDASRAAYVEVLADETGQTTAGFANRAIEWFSERGVITERVMTDNGSAYKSTLFRSAIAAKKASHIYTRPYTPKTNGKAERLIQTLLREWAYGKPFTSSEQRTALLADYLHCYNFHRPHTAHRGLPPMSRITPNNLFGYHT